MSYIVGFDSKQNAHIFVSALAILFVSSLSSSFIFVFIPSTDLYRSYMFLRRSWTKLSQFLGIFLPTIERNEPLQYIFIGLILDIFSRKTEPLACSLMIQSGCL